MTVKIQPVPVKLDDKGLFLHPAFAGMLRAHEHVSSAWFRMRGGSHAVDAVRKGGMPAEKEGAFVLEVFDMPDLQHNGVIYFVPGATSVGVRYG